MKILFHLKVVFQILSYEKIIVHLNLLKTVFDYCIRHKKEKDVYNTKLF